MASDLEKVTFEEKAATITRDIVVALAGSLQNPNVGIPTAAQAQGEGLANVYSILQAAVLKTLKSQAS